MVFNSAHADTNAARLTTLLAQFDTIEFDADGAIEFGRLRAELRRQGRPIPMFDVLIASIARQHQLTLVSNDKHFFAVSDLSTVSWTD